MGPPHNTRRGRSARRQENSAEADQAANSGTQSSPRAAREDAPHRNQTTSSRSPINSKESDAETHVESHSTNQTQNHSEQLTTADKATLQECQRTLKRLSQNLDKRSTDLHNLLVRGTPLSQQSENFQIELDGFVEICEDALKRMDEQLHRFSTHIATLSCENDHQALEHVQNDVDRYANVSDEAHAVLSKGRSSLRYLREKVSAAKVVQTPDTHMAGLHDGQTTQPPRDSATLESSDDTQISQTSVTAGSSNDSNVMLSQINRLIALYEAQNQPNTPITNQIPQTPVRQEAHASLDRSKLTRLEMPKFNGDLLNWKPFWDRFENTVDKSNLPAVEKMCHLVDCMEGEAKKQVQGLSLTTENYSVAVQMLKNRYGKRSDLIAAIYRKITELPPITNEPSVFRHFATELESQLSALEALGEAPVGPLLTGTILRKIPKDLLLTMDMIKPECEDWTVPRLRQSITAHVSRIERAAREAYNAYEEIGYTADALLANETWSENRQQQKRGLSMTGPATSRGPMLRNKAIAPSQIGQNRYFTNKNHLPQNNISCVFCGDKHYSSDCPRYTTVDARRARIRDRCTICLSRQHPRSQCYSVKPCFHCKRTRSHHTSLCFERFGSPPEMQTIANDDYDAEPCNQSIAQSTSSVVVEQQPQNANTENCSLALNEKVVMQTARVAISNPATHATTQTIVLLDGGSARTYVTTALAKLLQLRVAKGPPIGVNRFATGKCVTIPTNTAEVEITMRTGDTMKVPVTVVDTITGTLCRTAINIPEVRRITKKLEMADVYPTKTEHKPLEMLIGNDYWADIVTGERLMIQPGLYLLGSKFGWILSGRLPMHDDTEERGMSQLALCALATGSVTAVAQIHGIEYADVPGVPDMSDLYSLEAVGIKGEPLISDDEVALENFTRTVEKKEGRYHVTLPFREGAKETLSSNYNLALGRLRSLLRRLGDKPELLEKYNRIHEDQKAKGVIELVDENVETGPVSHYLPHHAVITPQKETTKVRIVYDGSAKTRPDQLSLNQSLLRGPVLLEDLCGLFMRFRHHPIAMVSDIEKAFLQVAVHVQDRDVTRFLWLKDPTKPKIDNNVVTYRFCRVPFGLNCSPFLLAVVMRHHLLQYPESACAQTLLENHYVDNCITGVGSVEEGKQFYTEAKAILQKAGMNLTQWVSNNPEIMSTIPEGDQSKKTEKILGILWNPKTDCIAIAHPTPATLKIATKRELLSALGAVFDPLGLIAPVLVKGKLLLQKVSQDKKGWDESLDTCHKDAVDAIIANIEQIRAIQLPRYIGMLTGPTKVELICFCDASFDCYATVVYVRIEDNGNICSHIVFAKSRLNPTKKMTIPRLELLAILIGTRALVFVQQQLRLTTKSATLCSDSQIALSWILCNEKLDTWTRNRVREIRGMPHTLQYRHVATDNNPADLATRGVAAAELKEFWFNGPEWICQSKEVWPTTNVQCFTTADIKHNTVGEICLIAKSEKEPLKPFGIEISRHFTGPTGLPRLLRITAICQTFVGRLHRLKSKTDVRILKHNGKRYARIPPISQQNAKDLWVHHAQELAYPDVISCVRNNRKHNMQQLGVQLTSHGILICTGRMGNAALPEKSKKLRLLPKHDSFTQLVLHQCHDRTLHAGREQMIAEIRKEFWIPSIRTEVSRLIRQCIECQKWLSKPYKLPVMPELPEIRVKPQPAFNSTGVDYFGPLTVLSNMHPIKVWVCLFTCLTVRAIHLELVMGLSTVEFLAAVRRFISRRGRPTTFVSDNAPQFKLGSQTMAKIWCNLVTDPEVDSYCSNAGIQWKFITEFAPWVGGVYERMISLVKGPLGKCLGRSRLTQTQLSTLLCEIEAVVNSRPLTYVGDDIIDKQVLTPNHFLMLNPNCGTPGCSIDRDDNDLELVRTTASDMVRLWRKGQNLLDEFWRQWSSEYLSKLRSRTTYDHRTRRSATVAPEVGHLVVIKDAKLSRGAWRIARIHQLITSHDGKVRSALVKLSGTGRIVGRPVNLLCPFELSPKFEPAETEGNLDSGGEAAPPTRRRAALKARAALQADRWMFDPLSSTLRGGCVADGEM